MKHGGRVPFAPLVVDSAPSLVVASLVVASLVVASLVVASLVVASRSTLDDVRLSSDPCRS